MSFFLDTSALVKIYHDEPGRAVMREHYLGNSPLFVSELTHLEFISATTRKFREGRIDAQTHEDYLQRANEDMSKRFKLLLFSSMVITDAAHILGASRTMPIRSLDAIQFAFFRTCCDKATVFVTSDQRLISVVESYGHSALDPKQEFESQN